MPNHLRRNVAQLDRLDVPDLTREIKRSHRDRPARRDGCSERRSAAPLLPSGSCCPSWLGG